VTRPRLITAVVVWLAAISVGLGMLYEHQLTPGVEGGTTNAWPQGAALERDTSRPTLVMVAHPRCACTRASITELSSIMTQLEGRVRAYVLFVYPAGAGEWGETELWRSASAITGVEVVHDVDGVEAARFGAATSGQTYLYAPGGALLFAGGITGARAHAGDNVGHRRVVSLVTEGTADRAESAVFGCALDDEGARDFRFPAVRALRDEETR
jgi:hypothetical protein